MRRFAVVACVFVAQPACESDVVLPDQPGTAVCGDGIVQAGEGCDASSPGCVDCAIVPGWTCPADACSPICGDGVVGSGPACEGAHRDSDCDMSGFWAVRETDYTCDAIFNNAQTSSNWYLYEITQSGAGFHVTSSIDCGVHVTGSVTVDYTIDALRAVMYENPMDGRGKHGSRAGNSTATEGGCALSLQRWYVVRGATDALLPPDFSADPPLSSLPPLPSVSDPVHDTTFPAGAIDPDGNGFPGIAFQLSGLVSGVRDSAQRVWKEYATLPATPVVAGALQFTVPGSYALQENILHVSQCGESCALLTTPGISSTHPVLVVFSFLGKTLGGARVREVVAQAPGKNVDADLATCANLRLVLPHDPKAPAGVCQP